MEKRDQELIDLLIKENEILEKYVQAHQQYEKQLEEYNSHPYLSTEEWVERKRIQKLKLAGRDRIEQILAEHRRTKEKLAQGSVS
jgi:hypothetical protein